MGKEEVEIARKLSSLSAKPTEFGVEIEWNGRVCELTYEEGKLWLAVRKKPKELGGFEWFEDEEGDRYIGVEVDEDRVRELLERFGELCGESKPYLKTGIESSPRGLKEALSIARIHSLLLFLIKHAPFLVMGLGGLIILLLFPEKAGLIGGLMVLIGSALMLLKGLQGVERFLNLRKARFDWNAFYFNETLVPKSADIEVEIAKWDDEVRIRWGKKSVKLPPAYALPLLVAGYKVKKDAIVLWWEKPKKFEETIKADIIIGVAVLLFALAIIALAFAHG